MTFTFCNNYWGTVGARVVAKIQQFFHSGKINPSFNHRFIALIPKKTNPSKVKDFRPISLCNVFFKIITKLIANRLRRVLEDIIHLAQAAFIPSRAIEDNSIINHEIMHCFHKKQGRGEFMAIKIDLDKAYDRVEWNIMECILIWLGFSCKFTTLIMECIKTPMFSILINSAPLRVF